MGDSEDLKTVKQTLRSLVVSNPTTMDAATLLRDYRRMVGEPVPCARYGYRDPVLFLRERCSDSFLFNGPLSNPVLTLIVPDSIKHIDQYVQRQKIPSKGMIKGKRRSVPESVIRPPHTNLVASTFSRPSKVDEQNNNRIVNTSRPTNTKPSARPIVNTSQPTNTKPSTRPIVNTSQPTNTKPSASPIVNSSNAHDSTNGYTTRIESPKPEPVQRPTIKVKSESVRDLSKKEAVSQSGHAAEEEGEDSRRRLQRFLERRVPAYQSQQLAASRESLRDDDSGRQTSSSLSSRSVSVLATLQAEITRLVARRPDGLWCSKLVTLYEEEYGRELPFARFRYPSVSACACAVPGLSATRAADGDWLLRLGGPAPAPAPAAPLRLRRARDAGSRASLALLDPDDALPGIDYDPDVFPADCLSFLESIPAGSVADVMPGDMLQLVVGEVYSPSHLWVLRLGPEHERMEEIMDEMTEYYTKGEGKDRVLAAGARRPGQYCASVFEEDWHRALIVQIVDSDTVKVRHVDYGTVDSVAARALRPLRRAWAALPAQAVRARLAGLRPAARSRRWPRAAAAACLAAVTNRRLVGNVVSVDREESILELFLIETSSDEDVNISHELIRAGHADPRPEPALGARESYLFPLFRALEAGATPNYAEIHALLRDGIALEFVEAYRAHVPALLPSDEEPEPERAADDSDATSELGSSVGPSPPPLVVNRVPFLSMLRPASPEPESPSPRGDAASDPETHESPHAVDPDVVTSEPADVPHRSLPSIPAVVSSSEAAVSLGPESTVTSSPAIAQTSVAHGLADDPRPASAPICTVPSSPAVAPSPAPAAPAPAAPAPAPAAPAFCAARAPHPASFYALPHCPCSKAGAACCPRPPPAPLFAFPAAAAAAYPTYVYGAYRPPGPPRAPFYPAASVNYFGNGPLPAPVGFAPSAPRPGPPPAGPPPPAAGAVRLSADECEVFELLSRVDPGAAHRYMMEALRRARKAAGLDPDAAEFRLPQRPHHPPQYPQHPPQYSQHPPQYPQHTQHPSQQPPHPSHPSHPQHPPHPSQPAPPGMRPPPGFEAAFK